MTKNLMTI